ncbi:MAG: hypothetical protein KBD51_02610 [Candidatus Levybacteria bacterium]|nr:hypothetical protein [Candidatus Levybacteria bacterium]
MLPDRTPGGGATPTDAIPARITNREANITTLDRIMGFVVAESTNLGGRPDSTLRISAGPDTYWTIQVQKELLGLGEDKSITAELHSKAEEGLPIESIRADVIQMFGTRVGGIHLNLKTGERTWDENADVSKIAQLVDEYSTQSQEATEKAVKDAADLARAELHEMTGIHNDKWAIEVKPDADYVTIWETRDRATVRLIVASPATVELPDGTPARLARITVQDLEKGTIVNQGRAPIRDLKEAMDSIFPDRAAIHDEINRAPDNTPA